MTIKTKVVLLITAALLGLALSISWISIHKLITTVTTDRLASLKTLEAAKHDEVHKYFASLGNLLTSTAANQGSKEAFIALENGFNKLHDELKPHAADIGASAHPTEDENALAAQYLFAADKKTPPYKSTYMDAHQKYHPSFDALLTSFQLHDVFLIDLKGNVIYTVSKENDFSTNLKEREHNSTPLAQVYTKALNLEEGKLAFEDFAPYTIDNNTPAAFVATPIFIDHVKKGVLAFQIPAEQITDIMQFGGNFHETGLGKTGECYLVGPDYLMRSNSRFQKDIEDEQVKEAGTTIGIWKVKTKSTEAALTGDTSEGAWIIQDYRGVDVLSVYDVIPVFGQAKWVIVAEIDKEEVLAPTIELQKELITASLLVLVLFSLITLYLVHSLIGKPLNRFQEGLRHFFEFLRGNTDEVKMLAVQSYDEIGKMAQYVNLGIEKTQEIYQEKKEEEWIKDGIGQLNAELAGVSDLKEVTSKAIHFISTYLNAGAGVLYVWEEENKQLNRCAGYAHVAKDPLSDHYALGEGVVGQVALQKTPIELTDIQTQNMQIETGTLSGSPLSTYTYPLLYQDALFGVIEVASFKVFDQKNIHFLNASNKIIATSIATSLQSAQVKSLLAQTEKANKELQMNQQRLEEANVYMEEQQQQLEFANTNLEEQQQQLEEANANMEEQQQQLKISEQNLKHQNDMLENAKIVLEKQARELELSSKYKSEFLANMSHELRTPLNSIIVLSQLLEKNRQQTLGPDDVKKAHTIFTAGNELLRLINDILDLSKVESGKMEVIVDTFDSSDFLETIQHLFEDNAIAKGLKLEIIDEYKDTIVSDRDRISQIVRNLISNALKFTPKGTITVKIARSHDALKPIEISVEDTGIGIAQDKRDQIFKAFTQADGSTSRKYGGTGLGLSISKELARLLGGDIVLEAEEGKGSKFTVTLPDLDRRHKQKEVIAQEATVETKQEAATLQPSQIIHDDRDILGQERALLVIDDDAAFAEIVYESIKKHAHHGLIAQTGKEGLELLRKYNVSGILLDLTLPDIDGIEILKEIKNDPSLKNIPVHIISSKDKDDTTIKLGAIGYGQKPLLEDGIDAVVSKLEQFIQDDGDETKRPKEENIFESIDLGHINILVVDDDIKNIFILDGALTEYGAKVQTAYNGKEAIEKLKADQEIDIVLMDIMMPVMDGYDAIAAIRADQELFNIPIIAVTAKAMSEDRDKCISAGADDFVSKPLNIDALIKLIKTWSDKKHR